METCRLPPVMEFSGSLPEKWNKWETNFMLFMEASAKIEETEARKVAICLNLLGERGQEIFGTFKKDRNKIKLTELLQLFKNYCEPKKNVIYERFKFYSCIQKKNQAVEEYITELKVLSSTCEFAEEEKMVRDRLVMGTANEMLKERLLREADLTLSKAEEITRIMEASKEQMEAMGNPKQPTMEIDKLSKHVTHSVKNKPNYSKKESQFIIKDCTYCKQSHVKGKCYAFGKRCNFCKKLNHFESCCKSKQKTMPKASSNKVHNVTWNDGEASTSHDDVYYISVVNVNEKNSKLSKNEIKLSWCENMYINDHIVSFDLDTGADCNVLPVQIYKECAGSDNILQETKVGLSSYGGSPIAVLGKTKFVCVIKGNKVLLEFFVVNMNCKAILGLEACVALNLVERVNDENNKVLMLSSENSQQSISFTSKQDLIIKYRTNFSGLGTFPMEYKIRLNDNAVPKIFPPRRIPHNLLPQYKLALDSLEKQGVIDKLHEPPVWLNNVVLVEKPNKSLRICLDPSHLNKYVQREHVQLPAAEEILADLSNKKYFTVLDLKDSFYQIKLDNESSKLCSFGTPYGNYKFLRLPFGLIQQLKFSKK